MASPQSSTLIQDFSEAFTSLHSGKRELIQWGANAVQLNRFVVDAAGTTGTLDPDAVLHSIDYSLVTHGDSSEEKLTYCRTALNRLIALQEEIVVLRKTAGEFGVSAGLLTIIGQAANQSPDGDGASVLKQLSELLEDEPRDGDTEKPPVSKSQVEKSEEENNPAGKSVAIEPVKKNQLTDDIPLNEEAANDVETHDFERLTTLQKLALHVTEQWQPLLIDVCVCAVASGVAIRLVN